jgi:hypothetical protein
MARLQQVANRLRWDFGVATKLSRDDVVRLLVAQGVGHPHTLSRELPDVEQDESEDAADDREADWLRGRYERMDDELLCDQVGHNKEVWFAEEMLALLDGGETDYRRNRTRSRVIDYLVRRDLRAAA